MHCRIRFPQWLALVSLPFSALATVREVPTQHATIQAAIDASLAGDTILVLDGTYYGHFFVESTTVTLASAYILDGDSAHIAATILDGDPLHTPILNDSGSVVRFVEAGGALVGFTIRRGAGTNGKGGGLYAATHDFTSTYAVAVRQCRFLENAAAEGSGVYAGGYMSINCDRLLLIDQEFLNDTRTSVDGSLAGSIIHGRVRNEAGHFRVDSCTIGSVLVGWESFFSCFDSRILGDVESWRIAGLTRTQVDGTILAWDDGVVTQECLVNRLESRGAGAVFAYSSIVRGDTYIRGASARIVLQDCVMLDSIVCPEGWLTLTRAIAVSLSDNVITGEWCWLYADSVIVHSPGRPVISVNQSGGPPVDSSVVVAADPHLCWDGVRVTASPGSFVLPANNPWGVRFGGVSEDSGCSGCCPTIIDALRGVNRLRGDASTAGGSLPNGDGSTDGSDLGVYVDYIFFGDDSSFRLDCAEVTDINADMVTDGGDLGILVDYIFFGDTSVIKRCDGSPF